MAGIGHWYVELKKQAYWRGVQHTWQNRYVMSGADPSASDATTVIGLLHDIENSLYPPVGNAQGVGFVEGKAYRSTGGAPFAVVPYNPSEAIATATGLGPQDTPYNSLVFDGTLESCLEVKTKLQGLNSRGKPMFLRKYIRGISQESAAAVMAAPIVAADLAYIATKTAPWATGLGSNGWVVISPKGLQSQSNPAAESFIGNHQVPRGRKRKVATVSSANSTSLLEQILNGAASGTASKLVQSGLDVISAG